jgi:hypothetical protein
MRKFTLLGAAAILFISLATSVMAQQVISEPGYCAQFYANANCQNKGPNNPYTGDYQTEFCRAVHMLRTVSARRALHSTGAVMAASIHATNRL